MVNDERVGGPSSSIGPSEVRVALGRILASRGFRSSRRLQRFLSFVVEITLAGREDEIKEYVIATEVYQKSSDYDPHVDSSVRVEATRLRTRLREYYEGPGRAEKLRIHLPRGGYVPVFERHSQPASASPPDIGEPNRSGVWGKRAAAVGAIAVLGAIVVWMAARSDPPSSAVFRPRPLTSDPGSEWAAAVSPDGHSVAFAWSRDGAGGADIFVRQIDSDAMLQLSSDPAIEASPAWSPDGTTIAFLRRLTDRRSALVSISALGGRERVLALVDAPTASGINWSPDGNSIAVIERLGDGVRRRSRLRLVPVDGGEEQSPRFSVDSFPKATHPAFSPDGSLVAFLASSSSWDAGLYVADLGGGSVRKLASLGGQGAGVAWTPDGSELIVGRYTPLRVQSLLRVRVRDAAVSEVTLGGYSSQPSVSGDGSRLVYSELSSRFDIARFRTNGDDQGDDRFIASTRFDGNPRYSPDGERIAFSSARSGQIDIWIADADGSNPVQLTTVGGSGSPRWSPDGSRIAFDSAFGGNVDVYIVSVDSGHIKKVTHSQAEDAVPAWSPDGRWLYFASDRSGKPQIWRTPTSTGESGETVQLTRDGGFYPSVSPDGEYLYFSKERAVQTSLWRLRPPDGEAELVLEELHSGWANWQATDSGIYLVDLEPAVEPGDAPGWSLWLLDPDSGKKENVRPLFRWEDGGKPTIGGPGFSLSPDGSWVLVGRTWLTSDLMLVEDFH